MMIPILLALFLALPATAEKDPTTVPFDNGDSFTGTPSPTTHTMEGHGIYRFANGNVYEGDFRANNFHGVGVFTYSGTNGNVYSGDFANGTMHGKGFLVMGSSGNTYNGTFHHGKMSGNGTYTFKTGDVYVGRIRSGVFKGIGKMTYANGDVYDGLFENDKPHGLGHYKYSYGVTYRGEFLVGKMSGHGVFIESNGEVQLGAYADGSLKNTILVIPPFARRTIGFLSPHSVASHTSFYGLLRSLGVADARLPHDTFSVFNMSEDNGTVGCVVPSDLASPLLKGFDYIVSFGEDFPIPPPEGVLVVRPVTDTSKDREEMVKEIRVAINQPDADVYPVVLAHLADPENEILWKFDERRLLDKLFLK